MSHSPRYPHWDVLSKWHTADWDEPTRAVVHGRLHEVPPIRFLSDTEAVTLEAVAARILPAAPGRVPIVPWIDDKLFQDARDGYRYEELPPLREVWRLGIAGIDDSARKLFGRTFVELTAEQQDALLAQLQQGIVPGEVWHQLPAVRFFRDVLCLTIVKIYYGHPEAWNEIGYNGPSSPRGHVRIWIGGVDPWEAPELQS